MNAAPQKITIGFFLLILILLLIVGIWHAGYFVNPQTNESPSPLVKPFSEKDQVIPQGAVSLEVSKALALFNFPKPLPFFDERNIVQSLILGVNASPLPVASTSTEIKIKESVKPAPSTSFLSYRMYGQSATSVREALIAYFISLGWKQIDDQSNQQVLIFGSDNKRIISINIFEVPSTPGRESNIVITLSLRIFTL